MLKRWLQNKTTQLFFVLWFHISLLNLFFVNKRGPVFLWQKNSEINTLVTHFVIALSAVLFYIAITKIRIFVKESKISFSNQIFAWCSVVMLALIGLVLF